MANHADQFNDALKNIDTLIDLPDRMRGYAIDTLQPLLESAKLDNLTRNKIQNIIRALEGIHSDSLRSTYKIVYNQCCILAVSALSAVLENFFIEHANKNFSSINQDALGKIKVSLAELSELNYETKENIGNIILEKDSTVTFQDLQSIKRSFNTYLNIQASLDAETQNKIIFYQQCRHVLVHGGGRIDKKFVDRLESLNANLKEYKVGQRVQLFVTDWRDIKKAFVVLVENLTEPPKERVEFIDTKAEFQ